ncbi:Cytochrome P450 107B1 [Streptomyces sp. YIM 130001]|uniref:cytochrome P450 family protein n=1 Tax=Streptomyces sp. YIM 130001 TaxID=2259644 RepID=UPI000E648143|nr:cytochrome P450 [Streptomyces sp. YIM 130001]RII12406.1 Cytochrome P450 107B1 [Streptomyces sp. YIM 130001]
MPVPDAPTLHELAPAGVDLATDPYPLYAKLQAEGPVHRVHIPGSGDCWLVVAHDAARSALTDPRLRNDIRHSASWDTDGGHAIGRNMLQSDPPQHTRLRRLVAAHFTPGRIGALRPRIEAITDDLLDALPRTGPADLVSRYALPLPVTVICELLGVPATDHALVHTWSNELVMPTSPEAASVATDRLTRRLAELVAESAARPEDDTLLSRLAAAGADSPAADGLDTEEHLATEELLGMVFLLLVAGHETTVNLISATLHSLLTHPAELARLRADPALTAAAVEESLRYNSPVHSTAFRFAAEPLTLAGTRIPAGDSVLVSLAAASRDPRRHSRPDEFDLTRRPGHLGFGHGAHHCLGAPLARAEATVAVHRLLTRHPDLEAATDPATLTWRTSTLLRGLTELPVRLTGTPAGHR